MRKTVFLVLMAALVACDTERALTQRDVKWCTAECLNVSLGWGFEGPPRHEAIRIYADNLGLQCECRSKHTALVVTLRIPEHGKVLWRKLDTERVEGGE